MASVLLEARPYRPFKSSEEYLEAMKEDLAEWLGIMYPELLINAENFMDRLDTGVALCKHANNVRQAAEDYLARRQARNKSMTRSMTSGIAGPILAMGNVHYLPAAKSGTFFARDNVSNFITWCRKSLKIFECLLFETDDLIMRKNEKHVILCLLEVARRGAKFGMLAPMLVQMERQIDREIAADNKANGIGCGTQTDINTNNNKTIGTETDLFETDTEDEDEDPVLFYGPQPQIITNDLKSLDEMVRDLVEKCTCPSQFPMVRVSDGKYRIGDTKVLIFVRILRSHVMVRVGGGWDTLSHYLDKHDPCRCKTAHRSSVAARLIPRTNNQNNGIELHKAQVIYERSPPTARKVIASPPHTNVLFGIRSRSPTPQKKHQNQMSENVNAPIQSSTSANDVQRRPMSPSPRYLIDIKKKQSLDSDSKKLNADVTNHVQFEENFSKLGITTSSSNNSITATSGNGGISINNTTTESLTKFENISDNGSEISDEGYRSLGVIQTIAQKRESLNSQTSADEIDSNARLDQTTSSDSQLSPTAASDDNKTPDNVDSSTKSSDLLEATVTSSPKYNATINFSDQYKSSPTEDLESNKFEQSGIFITEDEITVDIASTTGLRKTGFSNRIYGNDEYTSLPVTINSNTENPKKTVANNVISKIPRSPVAIRRRRSVDNSSDSRENLQMGSQNFNRKQQVYRSVRTAANTTKLPMATTTNKKSAKEVTNTFNSLRSNISNKKRPSITSDTFISPTQSAFDRATKQRASTTRILYDNNGRRIKGNSNSLTTSPVKSQNSGNSSPLAQQLLDAANSSKNDAQILEKMKLLLSKYSKTNARGKDEYDDFTSAWVHSNGNLERSASSSCSASPSKVLLNKNLGGGSSAASSNESTHSRDMSVICAPRTSLHRGISKIPGPVRHNTELY